MTTEDFKNSVIPFARKLYPMMKGYLKEEEDIKDALQDLLLKLWDKRNEIETANNRNSYVITMAKNYCIDLLKKKKTEPLNENDYKIRNIEFCDRELESIEKMEQVKRIIEKLPEKYREVIRLRDIDGFSFDEITTLTGFEIPHLRVILSRSRLKVREELIKIYSYENGTVQRSAQKIL